MKIEPCYVTFEQAKWLKEKGFDEECTHAYCQSVNLNKPIEHCFPRINQYRPNVKEEWLAPEQHVAIEWLRVNHNIDLYVRKVRAMDNSTGYIWVIFEGDSLQLSKKLNTPQEAYSSGFDYIRENSLL